MSRFNLDFGELRQRIIIYTPLVTKDVIGGEIINKQLWNEVWAKVKPEAERQKYTGHIGQEVKKLTIYMRYLAGLEAQMIVEFDGKDYEIQTIVNVDAADQWLKITVTNNEAE